MKHYIIIVILSISGMVSSQSNNGLELKTFGLFGMINNYETLEQEIKNSDGSISQISSSGLYKKKFTLGVGIHIGYYFNESWSAGFQGSIATSVESWDIIIPDKLGAYTTLGVYGKYHFSDVFSLATGLNVNTNYNYSPKIAMRFGPELVTSNGRIGLKFFVDYGLGGIRKNLNLSNGYNELGHYTVNRTNYKCSTLSFHIGSVYNLSRF